jgi:hypothetical protein
MYAWKSGQLTLYNDYVTGWNTKESGFDSSERQEIFLLSIASRPTLAPIHLLYPVVKRPRCEASI